VRGVRETVSGAEWWLRVRHLLGSDHAGTMGRVAGRRHHACGSGR